MYAKSLKIHIKGRNLGIKVSVFLIAVYIFFLHAGLFQGEFLGLKFANYLYVVACVPLFVVAVLSKGYRFDRTTILFSLFVLWLMAGVLYSSAITNAIPSVVYRLGAALLLYCLVNSVCSAEMALCATILCGQIHVLFILFNFLFPTVMNTIATLYFGTGDYYDVWHRLEASGYVIGLNRQASYAAMYISPATAYTYALTVLKTRKISGRIFFAVSFAALLLTVKRAPLGAAVIAAVVCLAIHLFSQRWCMPRRLLICIAVGATIGLPLLLASSMGKAIVRKFLVYDFFGGSGRDALWEKAIQLWKTSPVWGIGTNEYGLHSTASTHNSYLHILCENGLVGLTLFLFFIIVVYVVTVKVYLHLKIGDIRRTYVYTSLFFQTYYHVFSWFDNGFSNNGMFVLYIIMAAYPLAVQREEWKNNKEVCDGYYQDI